MVLFTFNHMIGDAQPFYYHRFSIFAGVGFRPVLAMGDLGKTILHFWDLKKLEGVEDGSGFDGDPLEALPPDESLSPSLDKDVKKSIGFFRTVEWSPDGKWLVAGYDGATLLICSR
jgi:hypothetical protein